MSEKLQQLAGIILVGNIAGVAFAVDCVEVNDHGGTLGADLKQIIKCALRVEQSIAPLLLLAEFPVRRIPALQLEILRKDVEVLDALGVLGYEMVLQELAEDFQQLPISFHRVAAEPGAQIREARARNRVQAPIESWKAG